MARLCFGSLAQLVKKAKKNPKNRETVDLLLSLVLSTVDIANQNGEPFDITDKNASMYINRKANLPRAIVAAVDRPNVVAFAEQYVDKDIRQDLKPALLPRLISDVSALVRDDTTIPESMKQEWLSCASVEHFPQFFSKVLLYAIQADNISDEKNSSYETPLTSQETISDGGKYKNYRLISSFAYPDAHFVGREAELKKIEKQMRAVDNKAFLVGMGGIGKSEIAKMYLKRHGLEYDATLWIPFEESLQQTIANDNSLPIDGISQADYPSDSREEYAKRKLALLKRIANRKTLLIIDNYDVQDDPDLQTLCSGQYAVIFTTRYHQADSRIQEIDVSPMTDERELMELFRAEYLRFIEEKDIQTVSKIVRLLEGHTLSIRLVASAMQSRRIRPERMLSILEKAEARTMRTSAELSDRIWGRLKEVFRLSTLSETELFILKNLSLIPSQGIGVETFYKWCELHNFDVIDGLIQKSWIIHDPTRDVVHLHPLIANLMLEQLWNDPDCCNTMLENFYVLAKTEDDDATVSILERLRHMEIAATAWERLPHNHCYRSKMLREKIHYGFESRPLLVADCLLLIEQADTLEHKLFGYERISVRYILRGEVEEGLSFAKQGYDLINNIHNEELTSEESFRISELLTCFIQAYNILGDYGKALAYVDEQDKYCKLTHKINLNNRTSWSEYNRAVIFYNLNKLQEGESIIRSKIAYYKSLCNTKAIAYCYYMLAMFLSRKGEIAQALDYNATAKDAILHMLGAKHIDIAKTLNLRAMIYSIAHDVDNACACWNEAISRFEEANAPRLADIARKNMSKVLHGEEWIFPIIAY